MNAHRAYGRKLLATGLLITMGFAVSCGSSSDEAGIPSSVPVNEGTDNTDPLNDADIAVESNPTTTAEVLGESLLSVAYVGPQGQDRRGAATPNDAVASVERALSLLTPGGTIVFIEGNYPPLELRGITGTPGAPIRIRGQGVVQFRNADYHSEAAIRIERSQHLVIENLQATHALWGVYINESAHISVTNVAVTDIGQEGIRIKGGSNNVTIADSYVADTGRRPGNQRHNGEGIYVGTGSPGGVDEVSHIRLINNVITRTTDEAIDIKRPVHNVLISENTVLDIATGTSGAVVVHLSGDSVTDPNIRIERNIIQNVSRSSQYRDGNCIVTRVTVTIQNNVLDGCQHRGIYVRGASGIARIYHNTLLNTGSLGTVSDEGLGMEVDARNNLGLDAEGNVSAGRDLFVNPSDNDYALVPDQRSAYTDAAPAGVEDDLLGRSRSNDRTTFGAVEHVAPSAGSSGASTSSTLAPPTLTPAEAPSPMPNGVPQASSANEQVENSSAPSPTRSTVVPATPRPQTNAQTSTADTNTNTLGEPARSSTTLPTLAFNDPTQQGERVPEAHPPSKGDVHSLACGQPISCWWAPLM